MFKALLFFFLLCSPSFADIELHAGPNSPVTIVEDTSTGSRAWLGNMSDMLTENGVFNSFGGMGSTYYAKTTGYGFSIPGSATIKGIFVQVKQRASHDDPANMGWISDNSVKLVKGGVISGNNKARNATVHWSTTLSYVNYGGSNDLWGLTLTPADINDPAFGTAFSFTGNPVDGAPTGYVDHVRITVYYTEAAPFIKARFGGGRLGPGRF